MKSPSSHLAGDSWGNSFSESLGSMVQKQIVSLRETQVSLFQPPELQQALQFDLKFSQQREFFIISYTFKYTGLVKLW